MVEELDSVVHAKYSQRYVLTFVGMGEAELENDITFIVDCYHVIPTIPGVTKCDISECYFVEKFFRI